MALSQFSIGQLESKFGGNFISYLPIADRLCKQLENPPGLFIILCPTPILMGKCHRLVEHHMLELRDRFEQREDTTLGTKAEVLCGLLVADSDLPRTKKSSVLVRMLFEEIMGTSEPPRTWAHSDTRIKAQLNRHLGEALHEHLRYARKMSSEPTRCVV